MNYKNKAGVYVSQESQVFLSNSQWTKITRIISFLKRIIEKENYY